MPQYDAIVIGTGQAGPSLAHRLAACYSVDPPGQLSFRAADERNPEHGERESR